MACNQEVKNVAIGLLVSFIGIVLLILPLVIDMDLMNGGFALMFISFALIIPSGLITAVIYGIRAYTLQNLLNGKNTIVHWKYTPIEWKKYAEEEYKRESTDKMMLFYALVVIFVLVSFGLFIFAEDKEAALMVSAFMFGLIVFIRLLIYYTTKNTYTQNRESVGEVYIGRNGILINKSFHSWNFLSRLEDVRTANDNKIIEFEYSSISKQGRDYAVARAPIPEGRETEAKKVLEALKPHL
jgi:hypothetical protein